MWLWHFLPVSPRYKRYRTQQCPLFIMNQQIFLLTAAHNNSFCTKLQTCLSATNCLSYPWRCLCFGFSQIILILPFLLITLHFSQIGLTDDLTFTANPPFLTPAADRPRFRWSVASGFIPKRSADIISRCLKKCNKIFLSLSLFKSGRQQIFFRQLTGKG